MSNQLERENTDYDSPWKSFIELYFRDFLAFFFPEIEADIDWSKPIRFLDKELQKVVRDAEMPKRYADKLVEVHRLSGEKALVICHIEVQNYQESEFGTRMYSYNFKLRDRYNCSVVSLGILTDTNQKWRPCEFRESLWGCTTHFEFPIVKLTDYREDWAALEANQNPFAVVVMAHLKTQETHNQPSERKVWKLQLAKMLYERGYGEQDILELNNFLDWMMNLPEELEREFQAELKAFEEAKQMKYVTTIERMAEDRGAKSREVAIALNLLQQGTLSIEAISQATGLTIEQVQQLQASNS